MFVDCVVQSGSIPAVMLIKELIETEQITGVKATCMGFGRSRLICQDPNSRDPS
jgi:hypothetical protein